MLICNITIHGTIQFESLKMFKELMEKGEHTFKLLKYGSLDHSTLKLCTVNLFLEILLYVFAMDKIIRK